MGRTVERKEGKRNGQKEEYGEKGRRAERN